MVRVLTCHHFAYQEVFTTDYEPHTLMAADGLILVATSQCYIQVHSLTSHACPMLAKFPTVSHVLQLVYSKPYRLIATLEEKRAGGRAVRVYHNWPSEGASVQPLTARIAGYTTSLRQHTSHTQPFQVIELPLKEEPSSIAVDEGNGTLAVAVAYTVLLYGFCNKEVADSKCRYEDMKMLLELRFAFPVKQVALCDEFVACASENHLQVVKLQSSEACMCNRSNLTDVSADEANTRSSQKETLEAPVNQDRHFQQWTFSDDEADHEASKSRKKSKKHSAFFSRSSNKKHEAGIRMTTKSILVRGVAGRDRNMEQLKRTGEILGPCVNPSECPVTVEYEDTCDTGADLRYLHNSVVTYIYRKFDKEAELHSLQLVPVYQAANSSADLASQHDQQECVWRNLVGVNCFISSPTEGYMYKVAGKPKLLTTLTYSSPAIQVCCDPGMLYAITETGVEVYTTRCLASCLHDWHGYDGSTSTLPPDTMEVCLLGMQPFIAPQMASFSSQFLVLFTKHVSSNAGMTEVNWSIYALKTPTTTMLIRDMLRKKEMIDLYHQSAVPSSDVTHLLKEAHLAIEGSSFQGTIFDPEASQCRREVCRWLAEYLARPGSEDWALTLPYFHMSGMTFNEFLKVIQQNASHSQLSPGYGRGALAVLKWGCFNCDLCSLLTADEANSILTICSQVDGSQLSNLLMLSCLQNYDTAHALKELKSWMTSYKNLSQFRTMDNLCLVSMYLAVDSVDEACHTLDQVSQKEMIAVCSEHPALLHSHYQACTPLGSFLIQRQPSVFFTVATRWLKGRTSLTDVLKLIESQATGQEIKTSMKITFLENLLQSSKQDVPGDAVITLVKLYLENISGLSGKGPDSCARISSWVSCIQDNSKSSDQNENLTKLQSLLCSSYCPAELMSSILPCLANTCHPSLQLLCLSKVDPRQTLLEILDNYPSALVDYLRADITMVDLAVTQLKEKMKKTETKAAYTKLYEAVLDLAAECKDLDDMLALVTSEEACHLTYIEKCQHINQARQLYQAILQDCAFLSS